MELFLSLSVLLLLILLVLRIRVAIAWRTVAALALAIIGTLAIAIFFSSNSAPQSRGPEIPVWQRSPFRELLLFAAMLLGMSSKYVWDLIEVRRTINLSRKPDQPKVGLEFDFWDFVQPLLVAALVFAAVLAATSESNAPSFLFSFQNGFFWQAVLKQKTIRG